MKIWYSTAIVSLLFLCAGCGSNLAVSGKVVFSDDKAPVPNGIICFDSGTINARGTIQSDGTFRMGSMKETDGLPPGTYKVFFIDVQEQTGVIKGSGADADEPIYTSLIDSKYLSSTTSGLTTEVTSSTKELSFELDRNPKFPKN